MAIIRNERSSRLPQEPQAEETPEEEEIDYSWHPSDEEFTSPITSDQWAELLGDATFSETDAARAMRCLRDYGGPATFQQVSIRYRGTMGRYRRWLNEAAQAAGQRYGGPAPQKGQFGMDEWWPLLYCVRNTGKPGAGIQEMLLRPEVRDAFEVIAEQERQSPVSPAVCADDPCSRYRTVPDLIDLELFRMSEVLEHFAVFIGYRDFHTCYALPFRSSTGIVRPASLCVFHFTTKRRCPDKSACLS
jgi:hypothetical protein